MSAERRLGGERPKAARRRHADHTHGMVAQEHPS
jgi:hypothetical protein